MDVHCKLCGLGSLLWTSLSLVLLGATRGQISTTSLLEPFGTSIQAECQPLLCNIPSNNSREFWSVDYLGDCTPRAVLTCNASGNYHNMLDQSYCIDGEWMPGIFHTEPYCLENCGTAPSIPNANAIYMEGNFTSVVDRNEDSFYHGMEILYLCREGYYNAVGTNIAYARCHDGNWTGNQDLQCRSTSVTDQCQDERAAIIVLAVFWTLEGVIIIFFIAWCCRSRHIAKKAKRDQLPNKKHSGNTYTAQTAPRPNRISEEVPQKPPPRPPARTDTAVVGKNNDTYYTYADVPADNGNDVHAQNIEEPSGPGVNRTKSIPAYLEIIS
ncbi:uncharacterized protein [Apostichopus japonicus]|uniref:uncharacterized protein isoform X2 n=1 Tax=Stichopus japonicus TaxID=307972 RepID=UPI003AB3D506